jgi:hypothetical protein
VRIVDGNGAAVSNATVAGSWNGAGVTTAAATTDSGGTAVLSGGKVRNGRPATFCVTQVGAEGYDGIEVCASGM